MTGKKKNGDRYKIDKYVKCFNALYLLPSWTWWLILQWPQRFCILFKLICDGIVSIERRTELIRGFECTIYYLQFNVFDATVPRFGRRRCKRRFFYDASSKIWTQKHYTRRVKEYITKRIWDILIRVHQTELILHSLWT